MPYVRAYGIIRGYMKTLIVTVEENRPLMNGERFDCHSEKLSGLTAYYVGGTKNQQVLETYIIENDVAYMTKGQAKSFTFVTYDGGKFRVYPIDVWGNADSLSEATDLINRLSQAAESNGIPFAPTAASTAGRICRSMVDTKQLAPRWRELAHHAIHQGPMTVVRASAENVIALDREKAFLRALYEPVPAGVWSAANPNTWDYLKNAKGIARATLRVSPGRYAGHIPALPVKYNGFTVYPTGIVRGVWTTDMIRDAVEHGCYEIVEIHELIVCNVSNLHAAAADKIAAISDSELRKLIYTRYWGRLASVGGFSGYRHAKWPSWKRIAGSKLFWYYTGKSPMDNAAPDYRPDHAAFIASANHIVMNKALRQYASGEIVATHIDCLWTTNHEVKPYDSFREKHSGNARFYGVGCYNVGGNLAAQGYDGALTPESVEKWGSELSCGDGIYRKWQGNPAVDSGATSEPVEHTDKHVLANPPVRNVPDLYSAQWTSKGWVRQ